MMSLPRGNRVGNNVSVGEGCEIGTGVIIGNNVTLYPNVTVGDNVTIFDGAVLGRPPKGTRTITREVGNATGTLNIGAECIVGANSVVYTNSSIGNSVLIGDLASIREGCTIADDVVVGRNVMIMYDTSIGARTRIIDSAIITGNMTIEADVFIGPGVCTVNDNEVYLKRFGLKNFEVSGPTIRRFAVVGTGANLSAGIEVGMGAIVAPSAMVTRDVGEWTVVAGVPARYLRDVSESDKASVLAHFGLSEEENT